MGNEGFDDVIRTEGGSLSPMQTDTFNPHRSIPRPVRSWLSSTWSPSTPKPTLTASSLWRSDPGTDRESDSLNCSNG